MGRDRVCLTLAQFIVRSDPKLAVRGGTRPDPNVLSNCMQRGLNVVGSQTVTVSNLALRKDEIQNKVDNLERI